METTGFLCMIETVNLDKNIFHTIFYDKNQCTTEELIAWLETKIEN